MFRGIIILTALLCSGICFAINCGGNVMKIPEMNYCAHAAYIDADQKLKTIYNHILRKYNNYPSARKNTIKAEKMWEKFRDAQVEMKYPPLKKGHIYGSMNYVFKYGYLECLTKQRIQQLKEILSDNTVDEVNI